MKVHFYIISCFKDQFVLFFIRYSFICYFYFIKGEEVENMKKLEKIINNKKIIEKGIKDQLESITSTLQMI